jgi:hypothetical protein
MNLSPRQCFAIHAATKLGISMSLDAWGRTTRYVRPAKILVHPTTNPAHSYNLGGKDPFDAIPSIVALDLKMYDAMRSRAASRRS